MNSNKNQFRPQFEALEDRMLLNVAMQLNIANNDNSGVDAPISLDAGTAATGTASNTTTEYKRVYVESGKTVNFEVNALGIKLRQFAINNNGVGKHDQKIATVKRLNGRFVSVTGGNVSGTKHGFSWTEVVITSMNDTGDVKITKLLVVVWEPGELVNSQPSEDDECDFYDSILLSQLTGRIGSVTSNSTPLVQGTDDKPENPDDLPAGGDIESANVAALTEVFRIDAISRNVLD